MSKELTRRLFTLFVLVAALAAAASNPPAQQARAVSCEDDCLATYYACRDCFGDYRNCKPSAWRDERCFDRYAECTNICP